MPTNNDYIDLQFEEVSPQRAIDNASFTQGLCDWRFSISPSSGGAWIPSMSYFLIEYTFSNAAGDNAPLSADKMTLGCDWAANLFTASSFKVAQYEICNVNSFHAQTHCLKKRMGYVHEDFAGLAYSRDGYDSDFSRRLAKTSADGMYHKDGLVDVSNANAPITSTNPTITSNGLAFAYRDLKVAAAGAAAADRTVATSAIMLLVKALISYLLVVLVILTLQMLLLD